MHGTPIIYIYYFVLLSSIIHARYWHLEGGGGVEGDIIKQTWSKTVATRCEVDQ